LRLTRAFIRPVGVGWVKRSETQQASAEALGLASARPSLLDCRSSPVPSLQSGVYRSCAIRCVEIDDVAAGAEQAAAIGRVQSHAVSRHDRVFQDGCGANSVRLDAGQITENMAAITDDFCKS